MNGNILYIYIYIYCIIHTYTLPFKTEAFTFFSPKDFNTFIQHVPGKINWTKILFQINAVCQLYLSLYVSSKYNLGAHIQKHNKIFWIPYFWMVVYFANNNSELWLLQCNSLFVAITALRRFSWPWASLFLYLLRWQCSASRLRWATHIICTPSAWLYVIVSTYVTMLFCSFIGGFH